MTKTTCTHFVGIDPGKNGGVAVITNDSPPVLTRMPVSNKDVLKLLSEFPSASTYVVVEHIMLGFKGSSKASLAKIYAQYQRILMALDACDLKYVTIDPKVWQAVFVKPTENKSKLKGKELKAQREAHKRKLKAKANEFYPDVTTTLKTCDALLLARYCNLLKG